MYIRLFVHANLEDEALNIFNNTINNEIISSIVINNIEPKRLTLNLIKVLYNIISL